MKLLSRGVLVLLLVSALCVGCSQKSGSQGQANAPESKEVQSQAVAEQAQPAGEQLQPVTPQQAQMQMPASEMQADTMGEEQTQGQAAAQAPVDDQRKEISGTVVRTEDGIALFSDIGHFLVDGQQLDDLVGKNVKVTAMLTEGAVKPTISVISVSVLDAAQ